MKSIREMTTIWNVSYVNSLCKMRDFELERELNLQGLVPDATFPEGIRANCIKYQYTPLGVLPLS